MNLILVFGLLALVAFVTVGLFALFSALEDREIQRRNEDDPRSIQSMDLVFFRLVAEGKMTPAEAVKAIFGD